MSDLPKRPELPGAELGHYTLLHRIGIDTFDVLGLAQPKLLYDRLVMEVQRYGVTVTLPSPDTLADWVTQSQAFAFAVWKSIGANKVERTMFNLPGPHQPEPDPFPRKTPKKRAPRSA